MSTKFSNDLIANQDDYSGGASLTPFINPWNRELFQGTETEGGESLFIEWEHDTPAARVSHRYTYRPSIRSGARTSFGARAFAHVLIDLLPDKALPELFEDLGRIYDFYQPTPSHMLTELPLLRRTKIKRGRRYERAVFPVSEG